MDESDLAWLERYGDLALSTEERKALVYAHKTGRVDNAAYRRLNHVDTLTASRALTRLEDLGLLRRPEQRRGPGVYYVLIEADTSKGTSKGTPTTKEELLRLLRDNRRLSRQEIATLILLLCAERPHTARELAERLSRNVDYIRNAYLSPLVEGGRIEFVGAPNDPNVAYRTVSLPGDGREGSWP
jgi:ATP-dependent DNA helicase RecG